MKVKSVSILVIVAALGYFVDIYDLILFGVVRDSSLSSLGFAPDQFLEKGAFLFNMQMAGMLLGGILWGILGDVRGRLTVLFGSIFLYSAANIANGFVNDLTTYAIIRFIAGIGLAGELGAGVTLVSETMSKENRGYGTMIIVVFGALGAVLAAVIGANFDWRIAYFIGGGLGLLLLILRIGTFESGMFKNIQHSNVKKGAFFSLFTDFKRLRKYLACIAIGLPVWFTIAVLIMNSTSFGKALQVSGQISNGKAIMYTYIGLSFGDLVSGFLSQFLRSRKKVVIIFVLLNTALVLLFLYSGNISSEHYYYLCFGLGSATGFWAIFVTIAAEQFGTNLRSTVTTTVPNFVRGAVVPINILFIYLNTNFSIINSALIVGSGCMLLSLIAILSVRETFGKDLDYVEQN